MNNLASFPRRVLAFLIDLSITFLVFSFPLVWISSATTAVEALSRLMFSLISWLLLFPLLFLVMQGFAISKLGGSIGKLLTGSEILTNDEKYLTIWHAFFRQLIGYTVSSMFFGLGFLWMLTKYGNGKTWHDVLSETKVVSKQNSGSIVGIVILVIIFIINGILWQSILTQYFARQSLYQETALDVIQTLSEKMDEVNTPSK